MCNGLFGGNSCTWVLILVIVFILSQNNFCGCGEGNYGRERSCGCDDGCDDSYARNRSCGCGC